MAIRAPITGTSIASSTPSVSSCNKFIVVKAPPFRSSLFGHGGWCFFFLASITGPLALIWVYNTIVSFIVL